MQPNTRSRYSGIALRADMPVKARKADGLRSIVGSDAAGFRSILESCLTPEELAQIPG